MSKKTSIVPFGWRRIIGTPCASSGRSVTYISPDGAVLSSIVEVCQYLEKDDTCKCGLRCPIHVPKVFSFNPEVQSVNLTEKEWCRQENKTESHRKNCQHWNKLQKTQIGKKKAPCHSELTIEPPPKLLIIRKDGQLRSVIPDERKSTSGSKKPVVKDMKLPLSPPSASSTASRRTSTISPLKSPLFESGTSTSVTCGGKSATKSKSDFKLQWIKADDEVSQNDGESGNELCFSPDLKKSPPMSFPQSLLPGLSSPPSLFRQEGQFVMPNMMQQRPLFMQDGSSTGLPSLHGGVEPVHRFGMSAFPGKNFVLKSDPSSTSLCQNSLPQELQRHSLMAVKSEQGQQQFNQPTLFGFPSNVGQGQSRRFVQPGAVHEPGGGTTWQQSHSSSIGGNTKQVNSNMSGVRPCSQTMQSPTRQPPPQQFPLGSPTMLNPTSPYGFQLGNSGQNASLTSPGHCTDRSPFSNRPLSRSSSIGTPAPSPGGHWQGARPQIPEYSRPHSRSSNTTTPGPDASPSQMPQWNPASGNPGMYAARNPTVVRGFTPNLSPAPASPFSPTRLNQNSNGSRLPLNPQVPRAEVAAHGFPMNHSASQQLRFHSQNVQQRAQQGKNVQGVPYQATPSNFGASQFHGHIPSLNVEKNTAGMQGHMFRPCPPYRPTRIQFARINEVDSSGQPRFPFRPSQPQIRGMQFQGPMVQQRYGFDQQQYPHFHGPLPTIRASHFMQPSIMNPGIGNPSPQAAQPTRSKPKRTRRRKAKQPPVKKTEPQQTLNTNFMSEEFPDLFGQDETVKVSNALVCTAASPIPLKADSMKVSSLSTNASSHATRLVVTPSLVMPSTMQESQARNNTTYEPEDKPLSSLLKSLVPENTSAIESQPTSSTQAQPACTQKDSGRGVTTPPLPVLSPTYLFEEASKGDSEDDAEFSDFANSARTVFDFPLSVTSSADGTDVSKPVASCTITVSTANSVHTPIVSNMVKQPNLFDEVSIGKSNPGSGTLTTSDIPTHSSVPAVSKPVQYHFPVVHSGNRDTTTLVSSSGKIFHLPRKCDKNLSRRRFSDHFIRPSSVPQHETRRRLRSDPYPFSSDHLPKDEFKVGSHLPVLKKSTCVVRKKLVDKNKSASETSRECFINLPSSTLPGIETSVKESQEEHGSSKIVISEGEQVNLPSEHSKDHEPPSKKLDEHVDEKEVGFSASSIEKFSQNEDKDANSSQADHVSPFTTASVSSSCQVQSLCLPSLSLSSTNASSPCSSQTLHANNIAQHTVESEPSTENDRNCELDGESHINLPCQDLEKVLGDNPTCMDSCDSIQAVQSKSESNSTEVESTGQLPLFEMESTSTVTVTLSSHLTEMSGTKENYDELQLSDRDVVARTNLAEPSSEMETNAVGLFAELEAPDALAKEEDSSADYTERQVSHEGSTEPCSDTVNASISPQLLLDAEIRLKVDPNSSKDSETLLSVSEPPIVPIGPVNEKDSNLNEQTEEAAVEKLSVSVSCSSLIEEDRTEFLLPASEMGNVMGIEQPLSGSIDENEPARPLLGAIQTSSEATACEVDQVDREPLGQPVVEKSHSVDCETQSDDPSAITCGNTDNEKTAGSVNGEGEQILQCLAPQDKVLEAVSSEPELNTSTVSELQDETKATERQGPSGDDVCIAVGSTLESPDTNSSVTRQCESDTITKDILTCSEPPSDSNFVNVIGTEGEQGNALGIQATSEAFNDEHSLTTTDIPKECSNTQAIVGNEAVDMGMVTAIMEDSRDEMKAKSDDDSVQPGQNIADDGLDDADFKTKLETATSAALEHHYHMEDDTVVVKPSSSNTSQMPCTVPSAVAIPSDLTNTVIRQLSNYNMILKNLLVSGVRDPATIAQLISAGSVPDETQNEVISALINTMQLFKEDRSDNSIATKSANANQLQADAEGTASTSRPPQVITDVKETASAQIDRPGPMESPQLQQSEVTVKEHPPLAAAQATSPSASSPNQGLQVPIVSSSVKGSTQSEEDYSEHRSKIPSLAKQKTVVQDEVSTSVKGSEAIKSQPPEPVTVAQSNIPEKRRARTRNAASKQTAKRPDRGDTSEKLTKRSSGSTSASSSNARTTQRGSGSSDKQNRNVKSGDLIWGQMRGFPSWPGKVVKPSEVRGLQQRAPLSEGKVWVKWFGDHTFTQMNPADLVSITDGLEAHHRSRKKGRTRTRKISAHLEAAIQEAVDELEQQQGSLKKSQGAILSTTPIVTQSVVTESPDKPRRGRKRKAT